MDIRERISERISKKDIYEITFLTQNNDSKKQELYDLLFDSDINIAYRAAWIMTHYSLYENQWLYDKQNELIDEVMICQHTGKCRLILTLLFRQPMKTPMRTDFLDFCLKNMVSSKEPSSVQALCMKLAYELCRPVPELLNELKITLQMMENNNSPATTSAKKNILKAMVKNRNLQVIY